MAESATSTAGRALTKRAVDSARYTGDGRAQRIVWDGELRGFGLRVQPTGRKSWILFYRTQAGTKRLLTLGHYPGLTLDQARRVALQNLADVSKGEDPADKRRRAREAASFATLAEAFLERHSKVHKKSARDDERYINQVLIPAFGTRKAEAIQRSDLSALHRRIGAKAPYAANRLLACASKLFAWGEDEGYLPTGYQNPTQGIKKFREEKRERWVTPEEMPKLAAAIRSEPNVYARAAVWMYLLLGARKSEMLSARWADVDLKRGVWRLPETKAGRPHYLPLAPPAVAILRELPREEGNPHVFPGQSAGCHLVNIAKPWDRIRKAAGCEDVRLHDLRRTVGSWLAQGGASLPLIGKVLNHTTPSTTAIYARLADESARHVLEQHAEAVLAAAQKTPELAE
jgi:integrase